VPPGILQPVHDRKLKKVLEGKDHNPGIPSVWYQAAYSYSFHAKEYANADFKDSTGQEVEYERSGPYKKRLPTARRLLFDEPATHQQKSEYSSSSDEEDTRAPWGKRLASVDDVSDEEEYHVPSPKKGKRSPLHAGVGSKLHIGELDVNVCFRGVNC
jgi:hypothetical protein